MHEDSDTEKSRCPLCDKTFKNVYSMSAHKGHCSGANSTRHLAQHRAWNKGKVLHDPVDVFVENSMHSTSYVKELILKLGLKEYKCETCLISTWRDQELVLELDHVNGRNRDHRIENVRFLCPNCHSQTSNFRGRNKSKDKRQVSDASLIEALKTEPSIRKALMKVGLSPMGGNYERCHKLLARV